MDNLKLILDNLKPKDYILLVIILLPVVYILFKGPSKQMTHIDCNRTICHIQEFDEKGAPESIFEFDLGENNTEPFYIKEKAQVGLTLLKFLIFTHYHDAEYEYTIGCKSSSNVHYTFKTNKNNREKVAEIVDFLNTAHNNNLNINIDFK